MSRASLSRRIRASWPEIVQRAQLSPALAKLALASLPTGPLKLAGTSTKIEKGAAERGTLASVVYMAGAFDWTRSCAFSTVACRAACLGHRSGRLAFTTSRGPQAWKLALYYGAPVLWRELIILDARKLARDASALGFAPALRIDGASDTGASTDPLLRAIMAGLGVRLWDYTKDSYRVLASLTPSEYEQSPQPDLTFSYSGGPWEEAERVLRAGGRVAVVVDRLTPALMRGFESSGWRGWPAVSGDSSDLRFQDPGGCVVLLSTKGDTRNRERALRGGFARPATEGQLAS